MARERVQPRRELRRRHIRAAGTDRIHPHILEEFVGGAGVAQVAQQVAIHAALVARVQRVEGAGVPGAVREHQRLVAVVIVRCGRALHCAASMRIRPAGDNARRGLGKRVHCVRGARCRIDNRRRTRPRLYGWPRTRRRIWRRKPRPRSINASDRARSAFPKRIGLALRVVRHRSRQHAEGSQVLATVVLDRDGFRRRRGRALELHGGYARVLAAPVARADLGGGARRAGRFAIRLAETRGIVRRAFLPRAALGGGRGLRHLRTRGRHGLGRARRQVAARVGLALGRLRRRPVVLALARDLLIPPRHPARPLLKHRHTDHADVHRPAGARGVRVTQVGEVERGGAFHALAPAGDLHRAPRLQHVARLPRIGGVARDYVDAVDARHRQHAAAGAVADAHRVLVTGNADDVVAAVLRVHRQRRTVEAIVDIDLDQPRLHIGRRLGRTVRERRARAGGPEHECRQESAAAEGWCGWWSGSSSLPLWVVRFGGLGRCCGRWCGCGS